MEAELPFDSDLQQIAADRAFQKLIDFRKSLEAFDCGKSSPIPWDDPDFWEPYFVHIYKREIFVKLHSEAIRYKKKYPKSDYEKDIEDAKKGSVVCLSRIIKWDRAWLFRDWVKQQIKIAQERWNTNDRKLLREVGQAVGKKPGYKKQVDDKEREGREAVLALVEAALIYHRIGLPGDRTNPLFKKFYEVLVKQEFFPTSIYEHGFEYFIKFLRRHDLIK